MREVGIVIAIVLALGVIGILLAYWRWKWNLEKTVKPFRDALVNDIKEREVIPSIQLQGDIWEKAKTWRLYGAKYWDKETVDLMAAIDIQMRDEAN